MKKLFIFSLLFLSLSFSSQIVFAKDCTGNSDCGTNQRCQFPDPEASVGQCVDLGSTGSTNTGSGGQTNTGGGGPTNTGGGGPTTITATIPNPFNCGGNSANCTISALLTAIVTNIIMPIGGIIAVLAFIWTGFLFVMAQGNSSKVAGARTALINTSIGTAVLLGAWVIAHLIEATINSIHP